MNDHPDLGDDLEIRTITRRTIGGGGAWVSGRLAGHRFEALVFLALATNPDWELDDSQISKLWVQRLADRQTVVNFDRGWDVRPTTDEAQAIVNFLAAGLAEHVFSTNA